MSAHETLQRLRRLLFGLVALLFIGTVAELRLNAFPEELQHGGGGRGRLAFQ